MHTSRAWTENTSIIKRIRISWSVILFPILLILGLSGQEGAFLFLYQKYSNSNGNNSESNNEITEETIEVDYNWDTINVNMIYYIKYDNFGEFDKRMFAQLKLKL